MNAISLTISVPIEDSVRETLGNMNEVAADLDIGYVLIGAKARDIVLHHYFGAPMQRATMDIDFAIYVRGWDEFHRARNTFIAKGYNTERAPHRLHSPQGDTVDIVPFGGVEVDDATIGWPPDGMVIMSVMGFDEACRTAYQVRFEEDPSIEFRVANLESQILLKLVAWTERTPSERRKDAADIAYILLQYWREDRANSTLWDDEWSPVLAKNDYDYTITAMQLLGQRASTISADNTYAHILSLLDNELERQPLETLAIEMSHSVAVASTDDCLHYLKKFHIGFKRQQSQVT